MSGADRPAVRSVQRMPKLKDQLTVATSALRPGMFIVALDRPWEGTPFALQGFLVQEVSQLEDLKRLCLEVVIDPRRSSSDALRDLIDLYELPEEQPHPGPEEDQVRIRYVESNRRAAPPPAEPALKLTRLPAALVRGVKRLREGPTFDEVAQARRARQRQQTTEDARPALPRFSQTQVFYAPVSESTTALRAAPQRKGALNWERREARRARQAAEEGSFVAERLARFEEFLASLQPDFSKLSFLSRWRARPQVVRPALFARWRKIARRPNKYRASVVPSTVELVIYRDRVAIQDEVGRAREAVLSTEEILTQLRTDQQVEAGLRVDGLPDVITSLVDSVKRNGDALIWVSRVRNRDSMAYTHGVKVASYLMAFGRHLGFPAHEMGQLATIGLLMDLGKMDVDAHILRKRGPLNAEEAMAARQHVELGLERLAGSMTLEAAVYNGIAQHHEWVNGEGYPAGLVGEQISLFGRMAAIADAYAALTSDRPYSATLSSYEALQVIYGLTERQFDAALVEQFVRAIGLYPVGSLVLLSTQEVAVVTALDRVQRLEPRVLVLTDAYKNTVERPYELDLMRKPRDPSGAPIRILRSLPAGVHGIDFRNFYIG